MNDIKNLEGKTITVYTDGGWSAHGKVELDRQDRMGLITKDNSVFIVLKSKISMIRIDPSVRDSEAQRDTEDSPSYHFPRSRLASGVSVKRGDYEPTESNDIGTDNQYGSILPADLLDGDSVGDAVDEFAVSFAAPAGKIEVSVDSEE